MSSMYHPISTTQSSPSFEDCKKTVQANWEKHKVKILVGTAIIGGGAAILLTGGLAALPEALAAALFFSGTAAVVGGFAYTGYTVFQPTNTDENEEKKPASLSTQTPDPMAEAGKVTVSIQVPNLMEFVELPQVIAQADSKEPTPTITVTTEHDVPQEEKTVSKDPDTVRNHSQGSAFPIGTLVANLMRSFVQNPDLKNSTPNITVTTEHDVPQEEKTVSKDPDTVRNHSQGSAFPIGTLVANLMRSFVQNPDLKNSTPNITVTIEATPPKEETEETITVTIEEAPEKDAPSSRELINDDIPEELMLYREEKPEIATPSSINSHIPSSKTTKKLLGYTLLGAAAIATAAYGSQRWYYLPEEEKNAYISQLRQGAEQLRQGAEYLSSTVQQGLSKMGSSLDIFSQEGDPTGLSFGTDPTNRSLPFPGPLNSCASPANPMRLQFGTDTTTTHFPAPDSTRSYFECYGSRMMNVANDGISSVSSFFASMYNSLPSGESIAEKFSINASSWGDSLEDWTQWASHADPVGEMRNSTMGQNVEKCFSAASEYVTSEGKPGTVQTLSELLESCPYTASAPKLPLEEMGIPFVDLANVKEPLTATQQGILQSLQKLTTCSPNKEIAAEVPSLDFLLSISGK